jgi:hypothetical protein
MDKQINKVEESTMIHNEYTLQFDKVITPVNMSGQTFTIIASFLRVLLQPKDILLPLLESEFSEYQKKMDYLRVFILESMDKFEKEGILQKTSVDEYMSGTHFDKWVSEQTEYFKSKKVNNDSI